MPVLNIAMLGSDELARDIAKASDQRDVHTYVHKESTDDGEQRILSLIRPARYPEKLAPFLEALSVSRAGFLEVKAVDSSFGEALVAFSSAGINKGAYTINPSEGEWVDEEQVSNLMQQAGLGDWQAIQADGIEIRSQLMSMLEEMIPQLREEAARPLLVPVDQYFNVKGIGLVAIGYVQQGTVSIHDELSAMPSSGVASARSLQVMDDDVKQALAGDRVGIAMRNAQESWLGNGAILVHNSEEDEAKICPLITTNRTRLKVEKNPFQRRELQVGDVVHISSDLQFIVGRITEINDDGDFVVDWDSPLLARVDGPVNALLNQLDSNPRIIGGISELDAL